MRVIMYALAALAALPAFAQDGALGERLYSENCAVCHGPSLRGDGPMASILMTQPPDLRQISTRYGGYFPREGIAGRIDGRDPMLSHGGEMPIFGRIFSGMSEVMTSPGGEVVLTSPEVVALVDFLEALQE